MLRLPIWRVPLTATFLACPVFGNTLQLVSVKDNTLFENASGLLSNGAGPHLFLGKTNGGNTRRALVQFDLSVLPTGTTVDAITLTFNVSQSQGSTMPISLHRVSQNWGEGGSNSGTPGGGGALAQTGDATWIHTFFNTGTWNSAGGDFDPAASATTVPAASGTFAFASSSQLVTDVQNWLNSPATNYGWMVRGDESTFGSAIRVDSRENSLPGARPRLSVDFTPPTSSWNVDQDGSWSDAGNWTGGVPDAPGLIARLGPATTAPRQITLGAAQTIGELVLDSVQPYTLTGAALNIQGLGASGAVRLLTGNHTLASAIALGTDTTLDVASAGDTLTLTGQLTASSGVTLTKSGAGAVVVRNIRVPSLAIEGGSVRAADNGLDAGTSRVEQLAITAGTFDLRDNDLIVDYAAESIAEQVRAMLIDGRLTASSATGQTRLGYADNAVLGAASFSGQAVDASSVLVKFTYAGDANLDGQVDITDLAALATAWQTSGVWINGDFDYSGFVDITDLAALATNWQAGVGAPLGHTFEQALAAVGLSVPIVPEPTGFIALSAGLATVQWRRRR